MMQSLVAHAYLAGSDIYTKAKPLPAPVTDDLDTVRHWIQALAGSLGIIALMILGIGMFFANRHGKGAEFLEKVGWWIAGAITVSCAGVIGPIFI